MVPGSQRRIRNWPLTRRLGAALATGSLFVALVLGCFGAEREAQRAAEAAAASEFALATSLAERGGPLLERGDLMRLSVLATVVRDQANGRALVLDRQGRVLLDTALLLGDRQLGLVAAAGAFQRLVEHEDGRRRETLVPVRFGGETLGEVRLQAPVAAAAGFFDATWFGLAFLGCLSLVACAVMLGHHWSSQVRSATDALLRLAAGETGGNRPTGGDAELQDLGAALRELERGVQEGLHRVGDGYVAMALQLVDALESRGLCVPGHGERTAALALRLADRLQLQAADREDLELACRLVDLGKAFVRASILRQGPATEEERQSLQHHPVRAAETLECVPGLRRAARVLRHQLERYDGKGTPDGLRGDRIPLPSRILAVAAAFDVLTTGVGGRALNAAEALQQLEQDRGEVFDPWLLELLAEEIGRGDATNDEAEVMIVPTGAVPWRASILARREDEDGGGPSPETELEVLLDEQRGDGRT